MNGKLVRKLNEPLLAKDQNLVKKRREQIIKSSIKLIIEKGFHRMTTREIAKECGFSIGTLYEYIQTKEDVLYHVCNAIYEEVSNRLEQYLEENQSGGLERLKEAIAAYFLVVDEMKEEILVMYQEAKTLPKEALSHVLQKETEMTMMFENIVRDCGKSLGLTEQEVKMIAHNILVKGHMWTFRGWALQRQYTLAEYTEIQTNLILDRFVQERI